MRAVALADPSVRKYVDDNLILLKVAIPHGAKAVPIDWPSLQVWRIAYGVMGGNTSKELTGCSVVSPDGRAEYANTGSAMVWELFDSTAYDAGRFLAMLRRGVERFREERAVLADRSLNEPERIRRLTRLQAEFRGAIARESPYRLPPPGFTIEGAMKLFEMSGDLKKDR